MKSNSKDKPKVFENLGNGAWHYNYNIERVVTTDESDQEEVSFDYDQIKIWGLPTINEVTKAVIASKYDIEEEIDLANDYRRFELGISEEALLKERYVDYLNDVDAMKAMIADSFIENKKQLNQ